MYLHKYIRKSSNFHIFQHSSKTPRNQPQAPPRDDIFQPAWAERRDGARLGQMTGIVQLRNVKED